MKNIRKISVYKNNNIKHAFLNRNSSKLFFYKDSARKYFSLRCEINYNKKKSHNIIAKRIVFCKIVYYIELTVLATLPIRTASQGESFAYIAFLKLLNLKKAF